MIVTDLLFGDSGKGTVVDWATRKLATSGRLPLIVRHSGGAQAAHAVETPEGQKHTFQQFGAGIFVPGVKTYLSEYLLFNPLSLFWESERLKAGGVRDALSRLLLHPEALVTTPWHMAANRYKEQQRGRGRHGSCGLGIGETQAEALAFPEEAVRVRHLTEPIELRQRLLTHRARKRTECPGLILESPENDDEELEAWMTLCQRLLGSVTLASPWFLERHLANPEAATIFEGSQGVLLDEWRGFHPYTTWSTVTTDNAFRLLEGSGADVLSLGVLRGYATRHGAGPFPTEEARLTELLPDDTNPDNPWQGALRVGWPDLELLRYGLAVAGRIDALAVTCLDRMEEVCEWKVATHYEKLSLTPGPFADLAYQARLTESLWAAVPSYETWKGSPEGHAQALATALQCPLAVTSWGKTAREKREESTARLSLFRWQT